MTFTFRKISVFYSFSQTHLLILKITKGTKELLFMCVVPTIIYYAQLMLRIQKTISL